MTDREDDVAGDERLRIDRWLWCARFFKSRSVAATAVRGGHVKLNGNRVKPAHAVKIGDHVTIGLPESTERDIRVAAIPARRGPAAEAVTSYVESPESLERRRVAGEERALRRSLRPPTAGKPDKRTRRLLLRAQRSGDVNR